MFNMLFQYLYWSAPANKNAARASIFGVALLNVINKVHRNIFKLHGLAREVYPIQMAMDSL